jgi:NAD+ kinase
MYSYLLSENGDGFMPAPFNVIGIYGRVKSQGVAETLNTLVAYLKQFRYELLIEAETASSLTDKSFAMVSREELGKRCHLVIVVGGDGSLLHAVHAVVKDSIPVLGINRGRLGFLTDINPKHLEKVKAILDGEYILEKRFLLSASVECHGEILGSSDALNEVALIPDSVPHMNEFEIFIDNQFVCSQDSDGVIIATPTGSTAYALSGGGPILHPKLDAMVIVPMFPHTLSMRPIVIEGNSRITIVITPNNSATPRLACDGQTFIKTPPASHITITKKTLALHLIHPIDYDYYESLRSKLHWGRKLEYTE